MSSLSGPARTELLAACARAKVELSTAETARVDVAKALGSSSGGKKGGGVVEVSRGEFERLIQGLLERAKDRVQEVRGRQAGRGGVGWRRLR